MIKAVVQNPCGKKRKRKKIVKKVKRNPYIRRSSKTKVPMHKTMFSDTFAKKIVSFSEGVIDEILKSKMNSVEVEFSNSDLPLLYELRNHFKKA